MIQLKSFPSYFVTEEGNVYNSRGLRLKKQVNIDGYFVVNLYLNGKDFHRRLCRLVAEAYLPDYCEDLVVNHKDLDKQNDHVSNLEMVTILENTQHSLKLQPEKHGARSISHETVESICQHICDGMSNINIAKLFNIERDLVAKIRRGTTWKHVTSKYKFPEHTRLADERCVREACRLIAQGVKPTPILLDMKSRGFNNISIDVIKDVKAKATWTHISDEYFGYAFNDQSLRS